MQAAPAARQAILFSNHPARRLSRSRRRRKDAYHAHLVDETFGVNRSLGQLRLHLR